MASVRLRDFNSSPQAPTPPLVATHFSLHLAEIFYRPPRRAARAERESGTWITTSFPGSHRSRPSYWTRLAAVRCDRVDSVSIRIS